MKDAVHLFVDVDDTLMLWTWDIPEEGSLLPVPNWRLVGYLYDWLKADERHRVTIWSLGGEDWAREVAGRFNLLQHPRVTTEKRWPRLARPGEWYIDDEPFATYAAQCTHARDVPLTFEVPA